MKVIAINSSPHKGTGNTALILNPFLEEIADTGAEVELFYTKELKINPCQGDHSCWRKTHGECFQKDDMAVLLPKLSEADIWVLATPLYVDGMTGPMKNLLDRLMPLEAYLVDLHAGHSGHPKCQSYKFGKLVLVSTCGFWAIDNFDPLLLHIKAICKNARREFAGALLRPHAYALREMSNQGMPIDDIFTAAKDAGRQIVIDGKMSPETLEIVSRKLTCSTD